MLMRADCSKGLSNTSGSEIVGPFFCQSKSGELHRHDGFAIEGVIARVETAEIARCISKLNVPVVGGRLNKRRRTCISFH